MTYTETALVERIEHLAQNPVTDLTQAQREQFDQFHTGGSEAVDLIIPGLQLTPRMTVLDVGSGFGGPARHVAVSAGCAVLGVDITAAYVDAARALTNGAGLGEQVTFVCGELADLDRHDFDAAYTMHVQMNVADKKAFFTDIAQRLRPGARFATFEVCSASDAPPAYPLPWSLDGSDSYLATPDELLTAITAGGFETVEWADETDWVRQWFSGMGERLSAAANSATLPALLDDGPARVMNLAVAVTTGVVSIHRGLFTRTP
jgi:cyclopropane fatty-acyl-phospholipid synthase-like methyltransferase